MKFAVLGAGAFGRALGGILKKNGHEVSYYDKRLEASLSEVLVGADAQVLALPSEAAEGILEKLPASVPLLIATKGFLSASIFSGFTEVMAASGPTFAADLVAGKTGILTVTDALVSEWLAQEGLKFEETNDLTGVLICGALKNVYAMEAGRRGLVQGSDEWQEFIEGALTEMKEILALNGGEAATAELSCGRGDLELTCGEGSRNYQFGQKLGKCLKMADLDETHPNKKLGTCLKNDETEVTVEGLATLRRVKAGALKVPGRAVILKEIVEETWA